VPGFRCRVAIDEIRLIVFASRPGELDGQVIFLPL
jgi:hypothetical protein